MSGVFILLQCVPPEYAAIPKTDLVVLAVPFHLQSIRLIEIYK